MQPERKPTYTSLQAGRGLAAMMVVVFHTTTFVGGDPRYWHQQWLSVRLAGLALGVEYFFVLSGAVILLAHLDDIGRPATLGSYLLKRFRRVYPIYWLVLAVVVLGYWMRPGMGAAWQTDPWVVLSGFLLVYFHTLRVNLPVAWTLFHEVLFYIVFATLLLSRRLGAAVLATWCALSVLMLFHPWSIYFGFYFLSPLHLLFVFGMLAGWLLRCRRVPAPALLIALGSSGFLFAVVQTGRWGAAGIWIDLLAGVAAALLLLGAAQFEQQRQLVVPQALKFAGDASYSIYLIHYPFFMAITPLVYHLSLRWRLPIALPFVLMSVAAIAVGCCMHLWVERPLLKLLGARRRPVGVVSSTQLGEVA